jgi:hypothetical protein
MYARTRVKLNSSNASWENHLKFIYKAMDQKIKTNFDYRVYHILRSRIIPLVLPKKIILGGHVYRPNGTKWRNFIEDLT